ncbi:acyl-CoA dehydrogenase family protein [Marinobacterium maritimum]|uniref:Acyl-CoA dehydrogenase family protein n=1 Tax=Marinobacterium maritimum TaxID=500162 RepID=A0ABN1I4P6_9GAMM
MEQTDQLILDTATRLFTDHCEAEVVNKAESGEVPDSLLKSIIETGLPLAWVSEEAGGVGGSLALGFGLIRLSAAFALPAPLAETMVANQLLAQAGLEVAVSWAAPIFDASALPRLHGNHVSGIVEEAPGVAEEAVLVVPVAEGDTIRIAVIDPEAVILEPRESLAGEPRTRVTLDTVVPRVLSEPVAGMTEAGLRQFFALVRASQIAGALEKINDLTVAYVQERQQFGRPLGKFQAIQHKVADIAGESALASAAVEQAVRTLSAQKAPFSGAAETGLAVATAKVVTSTASGLVARIAHQSHGAMGFSFEYPLQQYSRRILGWRDEYGTEFYWGEWIAQVVAGEIRDAGSTAWELVSR